MMMALSHLPPPPLPPPPPHPTPTPLPDNLHMAEWILAISLRLQCLLLTTQEYTSHAGKNRGKLLFCSLLLSFRCGRSLKIVAENNGGSSLHNGLHVFRTRKTRRSGGHQPNYCPHFFPRMQFIQIKASVDVRFVDRSLGWAGDRERDRDRERETEA